MSQVDEVRDVLKRAGRPLSLREIADERSAKLDPTWHALYRLELRDEASSCKHRDGVRRWVLT